MSLQSYIKTLTDNTEQGYALNAREGAAKLEQEHEGSPKGPFKRPYLKTIAFALLYLALFLFSLDLMSHAFSHLGQGMAESIIQTASNPFIGIFVGLVVTAIIQSSSTTTSIVVALVASNTLGFNTAIPIIIGANIGTTLTSTLVSLSFITKKGEFRKALSTGAVHDVFNILLTFILFPLEYYYGFLSNLSQAIAANLYAGPEVTASSAIVPDNHSATSLGDFLVHSLKWNGVIPLIVSFILLFASIKALSNIIYKRLIGASRSRFQQIAFSSPFKSFMFGTFITSMVQSSSITTTLIVPLAATGKLSLKKAFPFVMGANIGTTITALIAASFKSEAAMAIAICHLLFNLIGVAIFLPFPFIRHLPVLIASYLGQLTTKNRIVGFVYILLTFFLLPFILIYISNLN